MKEPLSPNTDRDKAKLERLRSELAIGEAQADRGQFAEDYSLEGLINELDSKEKIASGLIQSSDQAIREIEILLAYEEIQQNLKQAREDIESGNLFDAEIVFEELRK